MNYNMNEIDKPLPELLNMLRTAELNLKKVKPNSILMVQKHKGKGKPKGKGKSQAKGKSKVMKPKGGVAKILPASTAVRPGTGRGTAKYIWKILRRREVRLLLQVYML